MIRRLIIMMSDENLDNKNIGRENMMKVRTISIMYCKSNHVVD